MNIKYDSINDTKIDFKQYIRYNFDKTQSIIQIMDEPIYLTIKDKIHIHNSIEKFYISVRYTEPYMNDENDVYVVTSINNEYGVTIYNTWSYNNIIKNIISIKHYIYLLEYILKVHENENFSIEDKKLIYTNFRFLYSQIMLIEIKELLNIRVGAFMFDYEFIDSFGLKNKMNEVIRTGKNKINILKRLLS